MTKNMSTRIREAAAHVLAPHVGVSPSGKAETRRYELSAFIADLPACFSLWNTGLAIAWLQADYQCQQPLLAQDDHPSPASEQLTLLDLDCQVSVTARAGDPVDLAFLVGVDNLSTLF